MVSWRDPVSLRDAPSKRTFTFTNANNGGVHKIEAANITDAWVSLGFLEEIEETSELIEKGWEVAFDRHWNQPLEGEACGSVAGYFSPCVLPVGHEGPHQRVAKS